MRARVARARADDPPGRLDHVGLSFGNRNDEVEGLHESHEVEVLLDRERTATFTVAPPKDRNFDKVDQHLKARIPVTAGPHQLGVTFLKNPSALLETKRQPYQAHFNLHRHPRIGPAIYQVSINGPYGANGPGDTPSRRRIFVCQPTKPGEEERCAERILTTLMRRAYRRPVTEPDLQKPMEFYRKARTEEGFEAGIETALSAVLASPEFLFRVEPDPTGVKPRTAYHLSDLELASRISFFLWSRGERLLALQFAAVGRGTAVRGNAGRPHMHGDDESDDCPRCASHGRRGRNGTHAFVNDEGETKRDTSARRQSQPARQCVHRASPPQASLPFCPARRPANPHKPPRRHRRRLQQDPSGARRQPLRPPPLQFLPLRLLAPRCAHALRRVMRRDRRRSDKSRAAQPD